MIEMVIYVIFGIAALLGAESVYHLVRFTGERQRERLRQRMRSLVEPGSAGSLLRERRLARNPGLANFLGQFRSAERIERLLFQTDLNWTVGTVLGAGLVLSLSLGTALLVMTRTNPLLALLAIPVGCTIPIYFVLNVRAKRVRKMSEQMPDALDMMSRSLQAGHGISAAFKLVATEMPPPIAIEFGRCFEEHNLGAEFRDAVTNMTYRIGDNLDLKLFAVSLVIQHETGGNLVEIIDKISYTIRERYKFYGKLRALTAEGKVSGIILGGLPFACALGIGLLNPQYIDPLFTDRIGQVILGAGITLWVLGIVWLNAMASVDF
jgi:tight adherence protein B